ncbi:MULTISPECIES: hypothetical protein [unclassified Streptomyces]|uniref:hypothetical protein n=1 Tax=unclassified Streptomyces TaxID=2593676 RepID=UPI003BB4D28E
MATSLQTEYIDREGDVWVPDGTTASGELRLKCPAPQSPEDAGTGPSFEWTRSLVESLFGPLTVQTAMAVAGGAA